MLCSTSDLGHHTFNVVADEKLAQGFESPTQYNI